MIFLCHSYGGLVVKEVGQETLRSIKPVDVWKALLQAASAPIEHQDILTNIRGIIFLGTPHRGTKYSDYARAAALRLNRLNANPDIFLPLKVNSSALLTQHATFMDRYGHLDVVNFYETRAIPIFDYPITRLWYKDIVSLSGCHEPTQRLIRLCSKLVERFSATFDNATNALIDTHHSGLNKFGSRKDPGYRKVRFALEYMINRIVKQRIESQSTQFSLPPPSFLCPLALTIVLISSRSPIISAQWAQFNGQRRRLSLLPRSSTCDTLLNGQLIHRTPKCYGSNNQRSFIFSRVQRSAAVSGFMGHRRIWKIAARYAFHREA